MRTSAQLTPAEVSDSDRLRAGLPHGGQRSGSVPRAADRRGLGPAAHALVELVDDAGRPIGSAAKLRAHEPPGMLHRAFSVFLLDAAGRLILQRRAFGKYHSGGLWSNTCCGHPAPGEDPPRAASRRLEEELGLEVGPTDLVPAGTVRYEVTDRVSGLVEREFNHLFVGRAVGSPLPNAEEVADVAHVELDRLAVTQIDGPAYSAWFPIVLRAVLPLLRDEAADAAPSPPGERHGRGKTRPSATRSRAGAARSQTLE